MKVFPWPLFIVIGVSAVLGSLRAQAPAQPASSPATTTATGQESAAATAAEAWLALMDDGKYPATWDSAAAIFKKAVPREQWETLLKSRRQPFGKVLARKGTSHESTKTLPNAPEGQYVMLKFDASFENKKTAVETVTCVLDLDGSWRVTGYLVH